MISLINAGNVFCLIIKVKCTIYIDVNEVLVIKSMTAIFIV